MLSRCVCAPFCSYIMFASGQCAQVAEGWVSGLPDLAGALSGGLGPELWSCELNCECQCPTLSLNPPLRIESRLHAWNSWLLCIYCKCRRTGTPVKTGQIWLPSPSLWQCLCQASCLCEASFSHRLRLSSSLSFYCWVVTTHPKSMMKSESVNILAERSVCIIKSPLLRKLDV